MNTERLHKVVLRAAPTGMRGSEKGSPGHTPRVDEEILESMKIATKSTHK
jgi:hypothetical protein